jgi:lipopolysaccharide export system permease protein
MNLSLFRITLLDRYLFKDLYKTFIGVALVLVLILFANNLVLALEKILKGVVSREMLWQLMQFELLEMLSLILPPAFFFSILLSLGRLYRDSEIIAMQASGLGPLFLYRSYLMAAIPAFLLVATLSYVVMPWAKYSIALMEASRDREQTDIRALETGKFSEFKKGEIVFFAAESGENKGDIRDVFIQIRRKAETGLISATEGYQYIDEETGSHYMVLKNGYRYVGEPGKNNYSIAKFYEYGIRIREVQAGAAKVETKMRPTSQIWNSSGEADRIEMHFRLALPIALLALTVIAVPLSRSLPRQGVFGRFMVAFIVYFCFMNVSKLAEKWMENDVMPIWLGMWWVSALVILLTVFIEFRDRYAHLLNKHSLIRRWQS